MTSLNPAVLRHSEGPQASKCLRAFRLAHYYQPFPQSHWFHRWDSTRHHSMAFSVSGQNTPRDHSPEKYTVLMPDTHRCASGGT